MSIEAFIAAAWKDHADRPEEVADRLAGALALPQLPADVPPFAADEPPVPAPPFPAAFCAIPPALLPPSSGAAAPLSEEQAAPRKAHAEIPRSRVPSANGLVVM